MDHLNHLFLCWFIMICWRSLPGIFQRGVFSLALECLKPRENSGLGALKAEHIDTWSSDQCVQNFLGATLHQDFRPASDQADPDFLEDIVEPCIPGMCKHDPSAFWTQSSMFVRALQKHFDEKKILTGSLLVLKSAEFPQTTCFFFGGCAQEAALTNSDVGKSHRRQSFVGETPRWKTQVFYNISCDFKFSSIHII